MHRAFLFILRKGKLWYGLGLIEKSKYFLIARDSNKCLQKGFMDGILNWGWHMAIDMLICQ
jgi:hypothetical protein